LKRLFPLILTILIIAISWSAWRSISDALIKGQWFHLTEDEAIFAEVIEVFSETGKYGAWNGEEFSPWITAGPAALVPPALLKRMTGMSSSHAGRIGSFFFHLLMVDLILLLAFFGKNRFVLPKVSDWLPFALLTIGIFYQGWRGVQNAEYFMFGVFGESAALFYLVLTLFLLARDRVFLAAAAATAAVLAKPYMFFLIVSLAIVLIFEKKKRPMLRALFGVASVLSIYSMWMISSLGVNGFIEYWLVYPDRMSGLTGTKGLSVNFLTSGFVLDKLKSDVARFFHIVKIRTALMVLFGFFIALLNYDRNRWVKLSMVYFGIQSAWFLLLGPGNIPRYILPALIPPIMVLCVYLGAWFKEWFIQLEINYRAAWVFLMLTPLLIFSYRVEQNWKKNYENLATCGLCRQLAAQEYWKNSRLDRDIPIWTATTGYSRDLAFVLSASYRINSFDPVISKKSGWPSSIDTESKPSEGDWVIFGEMPKPGLLDYLREKKCQPVFRLPSSNEGFWKC